MLTDAHMSRSGCALPVFTVRLARVMRNCAAGTPSYSVYLLYWCKSTNTVAEGGGSETLLRLSSRSVYLLYWYKAQIQKHKY